MVEVTFGGGHATSGEHAGRVTGLYCATLTGGWSTPRDTTVKDLAAAGIGNRITPLRTVLLIGDLPCDVGDHLPIAGQVAWRFR